MTFSGFSPDSFEQMIRALCLQELGAGVSIFGNGPDGGREATFDGQVNFPHPPNNVWRGYGVIQAKFKEKVESTQKDQNWAITQLKKELDNWQTNPRRQPKPKYFIYCTNVALTSAINGGKDRVEKLLNKYREALGLEGLVVWDEVKLKCLIDQNEQIRKRFCHLLTTGDLLAALIEKFTDASCLKHAMTEYLTRALFNEEETKLSQAGDRTENQILLSDVFVDLPYGDSRSYHTESDKENPLALNLLLRAAAQKLDPLSLNEATTLKDKNDPALTAHFVFIGGPGSGKSTIGQFLSQIHRAALLDRTPQHLQTPRLKQTILNIKTTCENNHFQWPATPRYPFRIDLNRFAKQLADKQAATLSDYLRKSMSRNQTIEHVDFRRWLVQAPVLLILDGLDEVPIASNRAQVIEEITLFLEELSALETDLLTVASTRPDGYAGEFDSTATKMCYLTPLSKKQALNCAQIYVNAKQSESRAEESMEILTANINNPLIEKLMQSPLQVTFMVTLVTASGRTSESRWQLFDDYYNIIYTREKQKAVPPYSKVLNDHKQLIDTLHHDVGFLLQQRAESAGHTEAEMPFSEFEQRVNDALAAMQYAPETLQAQQQSIIGAANQRLVFLTCRTAENISFDVRSLQEYMAAACITNADSSDIISRLKAIAHSAYWRNTLLFVVDRFFLDTRLMRKQNEIRLLCDDLNRETEQGRDILPDLPKLNLSDYNNNLDKFAAMMIKLCTPLSSAEIEEIVQFIHDDFPTIKRENKLEIVFQLCVQFYDFDKNKILSALLNICGEDDWQFIADIIAFKSKRYQSQQALLDDKTISQLALPS